MNTGFRFTWRVAKAYWSVRRATGQQGRGQITIPKELARSNLDDLRPHANLGLQLRCNSCGVTHPVTLGKMERGDVQLWTSGAPPAHACMQPGRVVNIVVDPPAGVVVTEATPFSSVEEAAAAGDDVAEETFLNSHAGSRVRGIRDLHKLQEQRAQTGELGEKVMNAEFSRGMSGYVVSHHWVSMEVTCSPFDFEISEVGGTARKLDVKSTTGSHDEPFFVSRGELEEMERVPHYDLYRVSRLSGGEGELRIAKDVKAFAKELLDVERHHQKTVSATKFRVDPKDSRLAWGPSAKVRQ